MLRWSIERLGSVRVVVMVWWDRETVDGDTDGKVAFRWSAQKSRTRKGRRKRDAGTKQEAEATEEGKINRKVEVWKKKKKKKKKKAKRCRPQKFRGTYLQSDFLPVRSSGSAEAGTLMVQVQQLASERRCSTLPIRSRQPISEGYFPICATA